MAKYYTLEAAKLAEKSLVSVASHGALVIYRGKIVGRGYNKFCVPNVNRVNPWSIHAEVAAIHDALRKIPKEYLRKSTLLVVRVNNEGETLNSYPCENCRNYINRMNIKTAYYS